MQPIQPTVDNSGSVPRWHREFIVIKRFPEYAADVDGQAALTLLLTGGVDNKLFSGRCSLECLEGQYFVQLGSIGDLHTVIPDDTNDTCELEVVAVSPTFRQVLDVRLFKNVKLVVKDRCILIQPGEIEELPIDVSYQEALNAAAL